MKNTNIKKVWTDRFSFVAGAVRFKDLTYLSIVDDDLNAEKHPHSGLLEWDAGIWRDGGRLNWITVDMTVVKTPLHQMIVVSSIGEIRMMGSGDIHDELVITTEGSPENRGEIRCIREISGKAFVAGMNRTVYRRDDAHKWICIDKDIQTIGKEVTGFESIDGFSETDIYGVGWDGEICHFNGLTWSQMESPTNAILTDVICAADGNVYICGRNGLLISGRFRNWKILDTGIIKHDFWNLAWYNGELFISSYQGVYKLENQTIVPVDFGRDTPNTFYKLSTADNVLWSIGKKDVMCYDGVSWARIE